MTNDIINNRNNELFKKITMYYYIRVSTTKQDIARQLEAIKEWQQKNNIIIDDNNIFVDYYTGKSFDRENYQKLKSLLKENDYLIVKEVDRLGRDWDGIKKEWQDLKNKGVNIIIIDTPILSDNLPNEKPTIEGLDLRLIKEQILSLMCYSAQKEREKISQRTKEALHEKMKNGTKSGRPVGKPKSEYNNKENFIKTLDLIINNNIGQSKATLKTRFPKQAFQFRIKECYNKYNTKDYKIILERIKEDSDTWE